MKRVGPILTAAAVVVAGPALAEVSPTALAQVGVRATAGARLPLNLVFRTPDGRATTLGASLAGRPTALVFEDYRCTTLCGPALAIAASALASSGLTPGADYRLVAIGLNPTETPADAARMRDARLAAQPALAHDAAFLTGSASAIAAATRAMGFGYAFDPASGQYTHPVAAFVLTPDGRLSRVLSEVNLTGPEVGAALRAAAGGRLGAVVDPLALLCHGVIQAIGRFDAPATLALRLGALATLALMAVGVAGLALRRRTRAGGPR